MPEYEEGQTAVDPANGHRIVFQGGAWRDAGGGRTGGGAALTPNVRSTLDQERGRLSTAQRTAEQAEQFLQHNAERATGGILSDRNVPSWGQPHRQAMEGLSAGMVRANIQPGQASTMNSDAEQAMVARQYPSVEAAGPVNQQRALEIYVGRDVQLRRVSEMERWVQEHRGSLDGFSEHWATLEPQIRAESERTNRPRIWPGRRSGPQPGDVEDGYRFRGGNPGDRNNWEPVQPANYRGR